LPAFAQIDIDGAGTSHGLAVSDGDTVKFGRQQSSATAEASSDS
jgi:hypothetical protein